MFKMDSNVSIIIGIFILASLLCSVVPEIGAFIFLGGIFIGISLVFFLSFAAVENNVDTFNNKNSQLICLQTKHNRELISKINKMCSKLFKEIALFTEKDYEIELYGNKVELVGLSWLIAMTELYIFGLINFHFLFKTPELQELIVKTSIEYFLERLSSFSSLDVNLRNSKLNDLFTERLEFFKNSIIDLNDGYGFYKVLPEYEKLIIEKLNAHIFKQNENVDITDNSKITEFIEPCIHKFKLINLFNKINAIYKKHNEAINECYLVTLKDKENIEIYNKYSGHNQNIDSKQEL